MTILTLEPDLWRGSESRPTVATELEQLGITLITTGYTLTSMANSTLMAASGVLPNVAGKLLRVSARALGLDPHIGWVPHVLSATKRFGRSEFDLVLATGSPFVAFSLAMRIADRVGCPYVMDYRDLWTGNPHAPSPRRAQRHERALLDGAAAVTIVSPKAAEALRERYPVGEKVVCVPNGCDCAELARVSPRPFGHPAVVYAGVFYPPKRVVDPVMAAFAVLDRQELGVDWRFHYFGPHSEHVADRAGRAGVGHRVVLHGNVPRDDALAAVRGAVASVVVTHVGGYATAADMGIVTSKIYEAIGLGTPVLVITPSGSDAARVVELTNGGRCFVGADTDGIAGYLRERILGLDAGVVNASSVSWDTIGQYADVVLRRALA